MMYFKFNIQELPQTSEAPGITTNGSKEWNLIFHQLSTVSISKSGGFI
jgi:hypothetical protein